MQATQSVEDKLITSHSGFFLNKYKSNGALNKAQNDDKNVHNWYRFVLSFPPHLVRDYLKSFKASSDHVILDPFCGTGTTLVEAKKKWYQ